MRGGSFIPVFHSSLMGLAGVGQAVSHPSPTGLTAAGWVGEAAIFKMQNIIKVLLDLQG
jgi:hypothetical protein